MPRLSRLRNLRNARPASGKARRRRLRLLISAGPTREPIDAVRFISNYSTGYMGALLVQEALRRRHRATVVHGPLQEPLPAGARTVPVERAEDMQRALYRLAPQADAVLMAAAVADFRMARAATGKIARAGQLRLVLEPVPDILAGLPRRHGQIRAGFAVETGAVLPRARQKLRRKALDLLLAQRVEKTGAPFGRQRVHAWLLQRGGHVQDLGRATKPQIARAVLDKVEGLCYGQTTQI